MLKKVQIRSGKKSNAMFLQVFTWQRHISLFIEWGSIVGKGFFMV